MYKSSLLILLLSFAVFNKSFADLELPDIIANHMVLKQKSSVPIWGRDVSAKNITVETTWDKKKYETIVDSKGNFKVIVNTPTAGGPFKLIITGSEKVIIEDVLIGEVWISCGQSNMAFRMRQDVQSSTFIPQAKNNQIRLFRPERKIEQEEINSLSANKTNWDISSPETVKEFSAMTYYFAEELHKKLKVPVGVINVSWGGVSIESWMPKNVIFSDSVLQKPVVRWEKWKADYKADSAKFLVDSLAYLESKTGKAPELPQSVYMMRRPHRQYSTLYNGMVAPLLPYALSGMLWYQGTSSMEWASEYERQLNELIKSWRIAFNNQDIPVIVGQLTAFNYANEIKGYQMRNAQLNQRKLKNTYVFCSMDVGDLKDIHPTNKQPYGQRFAALALNKVYGFEVPSMCPSFKEMEREGNKLIITLNDAEGLYVKGEKLEEVFIAGAKGKFFKAKVQLDKGDRLIVSSSEVDNPTRVRYLYYNTANIQLYNKFDLPAFPFNERIK